MKSAGFKILSTGLASSSARIFVLVFSLMIAWLAFGFCTPQPVAPASPLQSSDFNGDLAFKSRLGVGAEPPRDAEVLLGGGSAGGGSAGGGGGRGGDSTALQTQLTTLWKHWVGPYRQERHMPDSPVIWKVMPEGSVMTCCQSPADAGGVVWGINDLLTRKTYRDIRLHVEFKLMGALSQEFAPDPGPTKAPHYANSGVYLQNRYEIQIKTPEKPVTVDAHEMGALVDQVPARVDAMLPNGHWQAYDVLFRAARWQDGALLAPAEITVYWNGHLAHDRVAATAPATGGSSGVAVDSTPQGLKLQSEGTDVRFRNIWVQELDCDARPCKLLNSSSRK